MVLSMKCQCRNCFHCLFASEKALILVTEIDVFPLLCGIRQLINYESEIELQFQARLSCSAQKKILQRKLVRHIVGTKTRKVCAKGMNVEQMNPDSRMSPGGGTDTKL